MQGVLGQQRMGAAAVFGYQYPYGTVGQQQSGGGRPNQRLRAMRERDQAQRNNQIIQAIIAMVVSGALDE